MQRNRIPGSPHVQRSGLNEGIDIVPLEEAIERFSADLRASARAGCAQQYPRVLKHLLDLNADTLADITPAMLRALVGDLLHHRKASSVLTMYYTMAAFFRWAVDDANPQLLRTSPLDGVPKPKASRPAHRYLTADDLKAMYDASLDDVDRLIIRMCGGAGLRVGELLGLRWRDVDYDNCCLRVLGKGARWRRVSVSANTLELIDRMPKHGDRVLKLHYSTSVRYRVIAMAKRAKLRQRPTTHMLRHSFAVSFLEASGEDAFTLQSILGHSSSAMTSYYIRTVREAAALRKMRTVALDEQLFD